MERMIEVYTIESKQKAVMGDIYRTYSYDRPPLTVVPSGEPAAFLDQSVEVLTSRIETACFVDCFGNRTEKYFTIDPSKEQLILAMIERREINRLQGAKMILEEMIDEKRNQIKSFTSSGVLTRIKWVFTGVKLEQGVKK